MVCADEVARLQNGKDPECLLAQKVFEQGHYAGRTKPTNTRQGTYATAPSGVMLASINSNDPKAMAAMLRKALDKWNSLSMAERMNGANVGEEKANIRRGENQFPADGLVLRVFSRDLPREKASGDWRESAWNQDFAWFTKSEASSMIPAKLAVGERIEVPKALIDRLAKFNFVDNVRGQTLPYTDADVSASRLEFQVTKMNGPVAVLRISGETKAAAEGRWAIAGFKDMNDPQARRRGMSLKIHGIAKFDSAKKEFVQFDAVALGTRFGATQYNGRHDDLGEAPIGFAIGSAGKKASERVAPSFFYAYRWPR